MNKAQIAASIPHEIRQKILLEWIPEAKPVIGNPAFEMLWEAFFIYVDPNGVKKSDCPICWNNVLNNWKNLQSALQYAEQEHNALHKI
jgi:hypothetical protein